MVKKIIQSFLIIAVLFGGGYFLFDKFHNKNVSSDQVIQNMKENLLVSPEIKNSSLTEAQRNKFHTDLKAAQTEVLNLNFDTLQGVNEIARNKMLLGDFEGARIAWEYANIIRPKNSLSFANLGALYHFDLKDFDKAEKNYLISLANDPTDISTVRNLFELYYYSIKDNSKAEALLLNSIAKNQTAQDLYSLTGRFYVDIGKLDKGLEYYQKHLTLSPNNVAVQKEVDRLRQELGE